jgi:diaminopimelate epimerase
MRVHERGAGITEACGTGAVAAAVAASRWGLAVPDEDAEILVRMDGGDAKVRFAADGELVLTGPATYIATIETNA